MFASSQKSIEQKPLKDANFLSVYVYVYKCMLTRQRKQSRVHIGRVRPKINDAAVVY